MIESMSSAPGRQSSSETKTVTMKYQTVLMIQREIYLKVL